MIQAARGDTTWSFLRGTEKLRARGRLPGAYAFDCAAHALRLAQARGLPRIELLSLALSSSWLVNNPVASPVFRKWLTAPLAGSWLSLLSMLERGPWESHDGETRARIEGALAAVAIDGHGAGALSKVLALLFPDAVPLMPDAALAFAIAAVPPPSAIDAQTAPSAAFAPMMDWFARAVRDNEAELDALGEAYEGPPLHPAQVLDRLTWFDSAGYRHFRGPTGTSWWPVTDGVRSGVIGLTTPLEGERAREAAILDLNKDDLPRAWVEAARAELARVAS